MSILDHFIVAVEKAIYAASNGCGVKDELLALKPLESELRAAFGQLILRPDPIAAAAAHSKKTAEQRSTQLFSLSWRGGGEIEHIEGWQALAKRLDLSENTIYQYMLRDSGVFYLKRINPFTNERDSLQVSRMLRTGEPLKAKRGRPRKDRNQRHIEFM